MKLIFHIGLPKCASTTLQESMLSNEAKENDLYCFFDSSFNNSYKIYQDVCSHNRIYEVASRINIKTEEIKKKGLKASIISNEEFIFLADEPKIKTFGEFVLSLRGVEIEFVLVVRKLEDFIRSYYLQLMFNGQYTLSGDSIFIVSYFNRLIKNILNLGYKTKILSLDRSNEAGGVVSLFHSEVFGFDSCPSEKKLNSRSGRGAMSIEILLGQLMNMSSVCNSVHINSSSIERERFDIRVDLESLIEDNVGAYKLYNKIDRIFEEKLENLILEIINKTPNDELMFWRKLEENAISTFN